jgi:hypothetical protein
MNKQPLRPNKFLYVLLVLAMLMSSALACTLSEEDPPTLAPRQPMLTTTPEEPLGPSNPVTIQPPPVLPQLPPDLQQEVPTNNTVANWLLFVDNNRMKNTVIRLEQFQNRHSLGAPAPDRGIHAAGLYLKQEFETIKADAVATDPQRQIQVWTQPISISYAGASVSNDNVFMMLAGTDSSAGVIVVGAHYDTISNAAPMSDQPYQPGANDNGSGVAVVLELARIMSQSYHRATIFFVLFAAEEYEPRFGSTGFRDYLQTNQLDIRAVLTLDMVGSATGPNGERYDNQMRVFSAPPVDSGSRQIARLMELVSRAYVSGEMNVTVEDILDRPGRWGDHEVFSNATIPAIRMIEYRDDINRQHNAMDTSDRVDANYMGRITKLALATMLVLADGPNPPEDYRFDTSNWQLQWTPVPGAVAYAVVFRFAGSNVYNQVSTTSESQITWDQMRLYESVAVAGIDANGQLGPFNEWRIPTVPTE